MRPFPTIDYTRLNMNDIHPEARKIAVSWIENYEKIGVIELEQKVKLASDIMNFAKAYMISLCPTEEEIVKQGNLAANEFDSKAGTIIHRAAYEAGAKWAIEKILG